MLTFQIENYNLFCIWFFLANEVLLSGGESGNANIQERLSHINKKWNELTESVFIKYKLLHDASHQYGEFKGRTIC